MFSISFHVLGLIRAPLCLESVSAGFQVAAKPPVHPSPEVVASPEESMRGQIEGD